MITALKGHTMKQIIITILLLSLSLCAEQVMKITFESDFKEHALSTIGKIVFTENSMVTGASSSYNLDAIEKIEFYDDGTAIINGSDGDHSLAQAVTGKIGFTQSGQRLLLFLPQAGSMSVSLYNLQGREVVTLFSGISTAQKVTLDLNSCNIATGIYSVVVFYEGAFFVRKIVVQ